MTEFVVLVDEYDQEVGVQEKISAHQQAQCHRAFSVFIYRQQPHIEILLQQRQHDKYHCGGLWTNTCCGHPRPGELVQDAAERRLCEEMGIRSPLSFIDKFHYIAPFDNGLTENEVDHVFIGTLSSTEFHINPHEVADFRWVSLPELKKELSVNSDHFTPWLMPAFDIACKALNSLI